MKAPACAIGLDVGGTKIAAGLVTPDGKVITRRVIPTLPQRGGEVVLEDALALAASLREEGMAAGRNVPAIGVGVGELVDLDSDPTSVCHRWFQLALVLPEPIVELWEQRQGVIP